MVQTGGVPRTAAYCQAGRGAHGSMERARADHAQAWCLACPSDALAAPAGLATKGRWKLASSVRT
jgi:hypothetical protein